MDYLMSERMQAQLILQGFLVQWALPWGRLKALPRLSVTASANERGHINDITLPLIPCAFSKCHRKTCTKGLAQRQARHAGDVSASSEQGEACELAGATPAQQAIPLSACMRT